MDVKFVVFIKKRTFAQQLRMVPYLSWIEQRPSKAWVLRSNRNGITKKNANRLVNNLLAFFMLIAQHLHSLRIGKEKKLENFPAILLV